MQMDVQKNTCTCDLNALLKMFVQQKRVLGYKYKEEERCLKRFADFIEAHKVQSGCLPKELVVEFCARRASETLKTQSNRISALRQFIAFLNINGIEAHMPKLPRKTRSEYKPYVFTHNEMSRIIAAADSIKQHTRYNCAEVYPILFRVLYGCGLRISEALNLRVSDIDVENGTLRIRDSKFGKSRIAAMSGSLVQFMTCFLAKNHSYSAEGDYLFKNKDGTKRDMKTVYDCFRELLWKSGIPFRGRGFGPRLHDIRHTFCCHALKKMSDSGIDMYCALPVLSAYVGHSGIISTERYLRLTEEFYPDVTKRTQVLSSYVYPEVYMLETD
jgi:integrase